MKRNLFYAIAVIVTATGFVACGDENTGGKEPSTVAVTGVELDKSELSLVVGEDETLVLLS